MLRFFCGFIFYIIPNYLIAQQNILVDSLSNLYNHTKTVEEKLIILNEMIELRPVSDSNIYKRGIIHLEMCNTKDAIIDFDRVIEINPLFWSAYISRAKAFYDQGDYESAIYNDNIVLSKNSENVEAIYNLAHSFKQQGKYDEAIKFYTKNINICIKYNFTKELALSYSGRGNTYFYTYDYENAKSDFDNSIKIDTSSGYSYLKLGIIYYNEKDYSTSNDFLLKQAIPRLVKNKKYDLLCDTYIYLHKNYYEIYKQNDSLYLKKAKEYADLAIKKTKCNDTYSYYMKGRVCYESGDYENALVYLNRSIGSRAEDVRYLVNRANTYYKLALKISLTIKNLKNIYYVQKQIMKQLLEMRQI
jgi:tetratricopeptide (TPR) repeat protein